MEAALDGERDEISPTASADPRSTLDDNDVRFGEPFRPADERISPAEMKFHPSSATLLNNLTANHLSRLMNSISDGCSIGQHLFSSFPILWIVDVSGQIILALEELVDTNHGTFVAARSRISRDNGRFERLGHPSLLADKQGRIGGEIVFDRRALTWEISNSSGRFGYSTLSASRTQAHLNAVRDVFYDFGIELSTLYLPDQNELSIQTALK